MSLEYIAGFFDGEGSIGIYPRSGGGVYLRTQLTQNITPATEAMFQELRERFGGNLAKMRGPIYRRGAAYNWQLNALSAEAFLKQIVPHLVIKKDQAEIAILWQAGRPLPTRNEKGQMASYPRRTLDAKVAALMKALKQFTIQEVMDNQSDLVEIVAELKQVICVKG